MLSYFKSRVMTMVQNACTRSLQTILGRYSKDISFELQRRALQETADFVQVTMPSVPAFTDRLALLDAAMDRTDASAELVLEFGVWQGVTITHLANRTNGKVYGFDSFEGLPHDWRPGFPQGHFKMNSLPKVPDNVELIKGWFSETLPPFIDRVSGRVRFLHVDCDLYSSTRTVFELLADRINSGTIIVFDEFFNYPVWQLGEFKAFNEFIAATGLKFEYIGYCSNDEQVAVKIL